MPMWKITIVVFVDFLQTMKYIAKCHFVFQFILKKLFSILSKAKLQNFFLATL